MARRTSSINVTKAKTASKADDAREAVKGAMKAQVDETEEAVSEEAVDETEETVAEEVVTPKKAVKQEVKPQKVYDQHDLILCRNVSAGWLKMTGKSGIPYVWKATGDLCEVEYGDLWARKTAKSEYLYKPYFVIEDEELLDQPRWKDLKDFYDEKVYGLDNVDAIINVPSTALRKVLTEISDGMRNAVAVRAATMIEKGTLDSLKKIKIIDDVCGTDLMSVIPD